jgi:hypothetical protein
MSRTDNQKIDAARAGARRLIEQVPKAFGGLVGVCGIAYLAGSVYTRAYFSEFGASWILEEVPAAAYFSQSWVPLLVILYFGYLATTNLAVLESQGDLASSARFKFSMAFVQYGPWLLLALLAMTPLLSTLSYTVPAIILSIITMALLLVLLSSAIELLLVRLSTMDPLLSRPMVYIAMAVIAVGLYVVPTQLGLNWARIDKQPTSSLLTVYLRGDVETEYKLLLSVRERFYVFPRRFDGIYPPVQAAAVADISFVPAER